MKFKIIKLKENERVVDLNSKTLDEIALILTEVYPEVYKDASFDFLKLAAIDFATKSLVLIEKKENKNGIKEI